MRLPAAALAALAALAPPPGRGAEPIATVVLLPLDNLSTGSSADAEVSVLVADALARKGYAVAQGDLVERFLERERVRYLDALPTSVAQRMLAELGADGVLTGTVYAWGERTLTAPVATGGTVRASDPEFAMAARMQARSGQVVWSEYVGLTGEGTAGAFQLGRKVAIRDVARAAVQDLLDSLPAPGKALRAARPRGTPGYLRPVASGRARTLNPAGIRRLCILPLEVRVDDRRAGPTVSGLLATRLREIPGLEVVTQGDFRQALVAEGIRSVRFLSPKELQALAKRLDTDLFVNGAVYEFRETTGSGGLLLGRVDVYLSMFSAREGRLVWSAFASRRGESYLTILQRPGIGDRTSLADQVVAELIEPLFGHRRKAAFSAGARP